MKSKSHCLKLISIRAVLITCALFMPSVCSAQYQTIFTNDLIFNLGDASQATLLITASLDLDVKAEVWYLGSKVTSEGQSIGINYDGVTYISVPQGKTRTFNIDLSHPAFQDGYGAVRVRSIDNQGAPSTASFIAHLRENNEETLCALSGPHLRGNVFHVPILNVRSFRVKAIMTAIESGSIRIKQYGASSLEEWTPAIPSFGTFRWDSAQHQDVNILNGSFLLFESPSRFVMTVYYEQVGPMGTVRKHHIHLPTTVY